MSDKNSDTSLFSHLIVLSDPRIDRKKRQDLMCIVELPRIVQTLKLWQIKFNEKHGGFFMDLISLKKRLSTYSSDKGYLKNVGDDVLYEVLKAWELWTGPAKDFYKALGFSSRQMPSVIGKAKKLKREGYFEVEGKTSTCHTF